jgi:hypothetical protein
MNRRSYCNPPVIALIVWILASLRLTCAFVPSPIAPSSTCRYRRTERAVSSLPVVDVIDSFYQSQPYVSAFLTCSIKASAADYFSQKRSIVVLPPNEVRVKAATVATRNNHVETILQSMRRRLDANRHDTIVTLSSRDASTITTHVDVPRNLAFLCYGGLYQGICEQFLYNTLFPAWFGGYNAAEKVLLQVATDTALIGPLLCLPMAYIVMSLFTSNKQNSSSGSGSSSSSSSTMEEGSMFPTHAMWLHTVAAGLIKYKDDVLHRNLLRNYWALWIPVQSLTFGVVPPHYRVVFMALISFGWVYNLSHVAATTTTTTATADINGESSLH